MNRLPVQHHPRSFWPEISDCICRLSVVADLAAHRSTCT